MTELSPLIQPLTGYFLTYLDLGRLIDEHYGTKNFMCYLESPNDVCYKLVITTDCPPDSFLAELIYRNECEYYYCYTFLSDLCHRGLIPEGTYILEVSW